MAKQDENSDCGKKAKNNSNMQNYYWSSKIWLHCFCTLLG